MCTFHDIIAIQVLTNFVKKKNVFNIYKIIIYIFLYTENKKNITIFFFLWPCVSENAAILTKTNLNHKQKNKSCYQDIFTN